MGSLEFEVKRMDSYGLSLKTVLGRAAEVEPWWTVVCMVDEGFGVVGSTSAAAAVVGEVVGYAGETLLFEWVVLVVVGADKSYKHMDRRTLLHRRRWLDRGYPISEEWERRVRIVPQRYVDRIPFLLLLLLGHSCSYRKKRCYKPTR